jgi:molybdopterin-guanine dinucleotide biosynthesis protein MobB
MIPIVSVVGRSDSGKTTLIEKLIPELVTRGYRVATIKHDVHGFDMDHEGKDSWRHKHAGARISIISSPWKIGIVEDVDKDHELAEIRDRYIHNVDIILSEGYKRNSHPKIEVFRSVMNHELLCTQGDNLLAIASDRPFDLGVPCVDINDVNALAEIIVQQFFRPAPQCSGRCDTER